MSKTNPAITQDVSGTVRKKATAERHTRPFRPQKSFRGAGGVTTRFRKVIVKKK
jgi:hypothetical protein